MFYFLQQSFGVGLARNVDLNRMQIFRQVVAAGSFSKAAALLHQPKSRISRNISALERELGVQLIYRTTRQFRLTDAGKDLYSRALAPLNELSRVLDNVSSFSDEISGRLRVTAPEDVGVVLIGDVCRAFVEVHPKVHIDLHLTTQILDLVKDSIDVAIRIGKLKDSSLLQKKIGKVRLRIFMSPALRDQSGALNKVEDLEKIPFLSFSHSSRGKMRITNGKSQKSLSLKSVFSANNHLVLRSMALQGMGAAMLPLFLIKEDLRQGTLVQAFPDWGSEEIPIQVVIPQQKEPSPSVKRFVEFTTTQLAPYFN
jgi:LysR family transcriptional regulator for bpeEF and oprC